MWEYLQVVREHWVPCLLLWTFKSTSQTALLRGPKSAPKSYLLAKSLAFCPKICRRISERSPGVKDETTTLIPAATKPKTKPKRTANSRFAAGATAPVEPIYPLTERTQSASSTPTPSVLPVQPTPSSKVGSSKCQSSPTIFPCSSVVVSRHLTSSS